MYRLKIIIPFIFGIMTTFGVILGIAYASSSNLNSTIIFVDKDAIGTSTGLDWTNAYTNLQDALTVAISGTHIWVAEGIYYPDEGLGQINDDFMSTFVLTDGVGLYGGFDPGSGVDSFEERDWNTFITVLSGDIDYESSPDVTDPNGVVTTTKNINGTNTYHVVYSERVTKTAVIDGFVITAGKAYGSSYDESGGGMYNYHSSPSVVNVTFSGNLAYYGGGMFNFSHSNPHLSNLLFIGNSAREDGGGLINYDSSNPTLDGVSFIGNSAYGGGGILNSSGCNPTLSDVTFTSNSAWLFGGGMYNSNHSNPTLTNVTFSGNSADIYGGGMFNSNTSSPSLTDVIFSNNSAGSGGGMYNGDNSAPLLFDVTFIENQSENFGGGMGNYAASSPTLTDVNFSKNSAEYGGGMYNEQSSPTLTNVTFSGNTSKGTDLGDGGGGMYNLHSSNPILRKVKFFGNSGEYGGGIFNWDNSNPTLINVIFSGNMAFSDGGGMYNLSYSSPSLINVTFSGNSAEYGGGILNYESNPTLTNVILWGNVATTTMTSQISNTFGSTPVISYTLIQNSGGSDGEWETTLGVDGGNNIDANPLFVRDPDSGDGDWLTLDDNDYGDLHLRVDSPAIDSGDDGVCPGIDLDDNSRPFGPACDMGVFELIYWRFFLPLVLKLE